MTDTTIPFDTLVEFEQLAASHSAGAAEQMEAPGLWRGIGYRLGSRRLVSGIGEINEILAFPTLTHVPGVRPWLMGVANVRGTLIAVVDLRQFVEGDRTPLSDRSRVLVAKQHGGAVGILVDEILGQRNFTDENQPLAEGDVDDRWGAYIPRRYAVDNIEYGVFSLTSLVRNPEFLQASA
jgi:twitching motility protein PilI